MTELALAPLVAWGPLATNGATALMSVLCVLALRDLLRAAGADGERAFASSCYELESLEGLELSGLVGLESKRKEFFYLAGSGKLGARLKKLDEIK